MSGQNKRINKIKKEIDKIILDENLNKITVISFDDEDKKDIEHKKENYDKVINMICEVKGELRTLSLPSSSRTPLKQKEYRVEIQKLEEIEEEMKEKKKQH